MSEGWSVLVYLPSEAVRRMESSVWILEEEEEERTRQ